MQIDTNLETQLAQFLEGKLSVGALTGLSLNDLSRVIDLGISCFSARDYDRAEKVFEAAVRIEPRLHLSHLYLGLIADHDGRLPQAVVYYRTAMELIELLSKERARATANDLHLLLASALLRLGRGLEAESHIVVLEAETAVLDEASRRDVQSYRQLFTGGVQ